ncbi:hypothetical protein F4824DRAFT_272429 [Ustulina deusta]|nr:hypothetical protein F4824DRAFT_272429 [Ustulina deusta]
MTMSFGSTKPIPESQTVLQLQWDCSQNEGATCQLFDSWIAATDGAGGGSQSGTVLDEKERRTIAEILRMETSEVTNKVESLLRIDLVHFERVRNQLLSLLVGWEQAILEKKRYDEEGLRIEDGEAQLSPRRFLILFHIIYYRARVGLTSLPTSILRSGAPIASMKYSTQSDPHALPERARL